MTESTPLRRPKPLRRDGSVAVLALSSPSKPDRIEVAKAALESVGLKVTLADNLYEVERTYLAGNDDLRAAEVNRFLRSPDFDAFFFARGGYGAMRILDRIDYEAIARNPRPIVGYSDLTALQQAVACMTGIGTFHGPMLNTDFHDGLSEANDDWFWNLMSGGGNEERQFLPDQVLSPGHARGILFGGCLSMTVALVGTRYDYWVNDGIWFWEEISEPTYRIDRMLTHLKLTGRLAGIQGVMIGTLIDCGGSRPYELDDLLEEFFAPMKIPVIRDLPFGHAGNNLLMPVGAYAELDTASCTFTVPEPVTELQNRETQ